MNKKQRNIKYVFEPESIAVVGASREPGKIGNVILRNLLEGGYQGKVYPINPKSEDIVGLKSYPSVTAVKGQVDCAVVCVKKEFTLQVVEECAKKGVKAIIMITSGFSETGHDDDEKAIMDICEKSNMVLIGPNCMGVISTEDKVDSVFLPVYKMGRPKIGGISFVSQSGAIGGCILDLASYYGIGMNKFVSYGNGKLYGAEELMEFLSRDKTTKTIACYFEGVQDGAKFLKVLEGVCNKKPTVILKGGKNEKTSKAVASHTSSLMGSYSSFRAAFRKANAIEAENIEQLFDISKMFMQPKPKGRKVGIITNGGGLGILLVDEVINNGFELAELSKQNKDELAQVLPNTIHIDNPLDVLGDANTARFEAAMGSFLRDESVDIIVVSILLQTIGLDSTIINVLMRCNFFSKKPIVVVAVGGEYTNSIIRVLESNGIPCYPSPEQAVSSLGKMAEYYEHKPL